MELPLRAAALGLTRMAFKLVGTPIGTTRPAGPRPWSGWSEERDAGLRSEGWTGSMPGDPSLLRQLGLPLRGVRALTSLELNTMGRTGRPNLIHYAIGDSA